MIFFCSPSGDDRNTGAYDSPMRDPAFAARRLAAGDTLYLRGGEYMMSDVLAPPNGGTASQPVLIAGFPGDEPPVLNAHKINFFKEREKYPWRVSTGIIFIYNTSHVRVRGVTVKNSTGQGIAVRDSSHVSIDGCTTENTFGCGISFWDTKSTGVRCAHCRAVSNTVINATTWDWLPDGMKRGNEPPHEAISVAGASYFEISHNHVYDCFKEGIDVKENSHHGTVHHNHVHHLGRQGLYVDAWFGAITHVDFYANNVHDCEGAGVAVSVEQGHYVSDIRVFENDIRDIHGSGVLFSTWGADGPRSGVEIFNNTIRRCGIGLPASGFKYFWITGGLCLLSANLSDINIHHNIFAENAAFDIGASFKWLGEKLADSSEAAAALKRKFVERNIRIHDNLFLDPERFSKTEYPILTSYEDNDALYGVGQD